MRNKSLLKMPEDEKRIVELYTKEHLYISQIREIYHCRESKIVDILHNNGIATNNEGKYLNRALKADYFDVIDTEIKAYLLGFITADGSVGYRKNRREAGTFKIELQESDKEILDLILEELNCKSTKRVRERNGKNTISICISSTYLVKSLEKYGVIPNKTYNLRLLYINFSDKAFLKAYLRGLFDGDGSLYFVNNSYHASFTEGLLHIVQQFQNIIDDEIGIERHTKINSNTAHHAVWNGVNCCKLCHYLYDDSSVFLTRKYNIAKEIFERYL